MNHLRQLIIVCLVMFLPASVIADDTPWLNEAEWLDLYEYAINKDDTEATEALLSLGLDMQFGESFFALSNMVAPTKERKGSLYQMTYFLRKAARQNHTKAQHFLSMSYAHGLGVVKDLKSYQYWAKKAAHNGSREAQYGLGRFYFKQNSTAASDNAKSIYWYSQAASLGHTKATTELALIHIDEDFGILNPEKALKWLWLAALKNDAKAQYWLGFAFAEGIGQEPSPIKAIQWWRKSADKGFNQAIAILKVLEDGKPPMEHSVSTPGESI